MFIETIEKPLTLKRKLLIWAMIFTLTPLLAYAYGNHEYKQSDMHKLAQPVNVALPAELSNIWEF